MYPYQDSTRPIEERIDDLLARMTTEEKIMQTDLYSNSDFCTVDKNGRVTEIDFDKIDRLLKGRSVGCVQLRGITAAHANAVQHYAVEKTRLGIPFLFSEEALHGLFDARATSFPQQIGLAASFDPELGRKMGHAIAAETRANGIHETYSPVMDLIRDPRYGRGEESYGEDTYLCGEFARETVRGMQGDDLTAPDAVAAEPKHYVGYGMPVAGLNCAPTAMGRHEVFSDCLPVFEQAFREGGAANAMCSYNAIDGVPVSMDHQLLTDVLRGQFGMPGFVRADNALSQSPVRLALCGRDPQGRRAHGHLGGRGHAAVRLPPRGVAGQPGRADRLRRAGPRILDEACRRVLRVKFRLGLFEHPYTDEHRARPSCAARSTWRWPGRSPASPSCF